MNVVLFAWCPSSLAYVEALVAAGAPPRLVVTGARCSAAGLLAEACEARGIELAREDEVNAPRLVERLCALPTDLLLVAGCGRVLGPALLALPRIGALNFHPSLLPRYRGREPLFWALLRGEAEVGITVHHLRAEVDAGPILFQRGVAVPARATSASLAALVDGEGASLVPEILGLAASGALPEGTLPERPGSHFPPLRAEHGLLDFTRSAAEIERLLRACQGEIPAYCFVRGVRIVVVEGEAERAPLEASVPGRVLSLDDGGLRVTTGDGVIRLTRFVFLHRVIGARALGEQLGLGPGDRLGSSPAFDLPG
jgi:methionyl-tRNA formyltransferase